MESYVGSVFAFGFNFAPSGWALCNGQLLSISENQALFALIGTNFGGDGVQSFAVPNLQGRVPVGTGQGPGLSNYLIGQAAGSETVTLTANNLPAHTHPVLTAQVPVSTAAGDLNDPTGHVFAVSSAASGAVYSATATNGATMAANNGTTGITGSSVPINIMNTYNTVNYCICLYGIFPQRN